MIACSTKAKNILQNYGNQPTKSLIIFETLIQYMIEMTLNVLLVGKSWKPFENSIQGSENKPVSQYENRRRSKKKMKSGNRKGMKSEKKSSKRLSQNNSILQIDRSVIEK